MRMSSSLVAPSAVAILSTALLCGLSGTAIRKPHQAPPLPSVTVEAPEQSGEAATAAGTSSKYRSGLRRGPATRTIGSNGGRDAVGCAGSCHGEACPARERGQQLQRWLRIELPTRQGPLGWMQRIGGVLFSFLSNLQRHTHPQGLRAMHGNQNVPGLGPKTILVVLHRHAGWGEISGHRRESKQVAQSAPGTAFGRTSYENVIELCRALSCRYPVDRIAVRSGTAVSQTATGSSRFPASRSRRRSRWQGPHRPKAGAVGKHGCSSPDIASPSNATDNNSKAGARFSDGEDCRARENLQQLHRWLPNKLQIRQPTLEWMLRVVG